MSYPKMERLSKLCELLSTILEGKEFVEIRLGAKEIGGVNLRIKGDTIYTNILDVPVTSWTVPPADMAKAQKLYDYLKSKLQEEAKTMT